MGSKTERLQRKYDRLTNKSEQDGSISTKEAERLATIDLLESSKKTEEISLKGQNETEVSITSKETKEALEGHKESMSFQNILINYKNILDDLEKQIPFHKRGESKLIKNRLNNARELLYAMEDVIKKNKKYDHKLEKKFMIDVRNPYHEAVFIEKMNANIAWIADQISQTTLADMAGSKKMIDPNVFDDNIPLSPEGEVCRKACLTGTTGTSGVSALGKVIDKDIGPWLDKNITNGKGTKVITGGLKLGLLVANGVMAYNVLKGFWKLRGAKGEERKGIIGNMLLNTGGLIALNYVDPNKVLGHLKDAWGFVSGDTSGNGGRKIDMKASIASISTKETPHDEKIAHGKRIIGGALCGLTYGELSLQKDIFIYSGNKVANIDCEKLLAFYKAKYKEGTLNQESLAELTEYVMALQQVKEVDKKIIANVLDETGVRGDDFTDIAEKDKSTIIGSRISEDIFAAKEVSQTMMRITLENKINTDDAALRGHLGDKNYTKLIDAIVSLSPDTQNQIVRGDIVIRVENGSLILGSYNNKVAIDINTQKITPLHESGKLEELPISFTSLGECLIGAFEINRIIHNFHHRSIYPKPFFYDETGNDTQFMTGPRERFKPGSWTYGESEDALTGGFLSGIQSDTLNTQMKEVSKYLNRQEIWMSIETEAIYQEIKSILAQSNPNIQEGSTQFDTLMMAYMALYEKKEFIKSVYQVEDGSVIVEYKSGKKESFSSFAKGSNIVRGLGGSLGEGADWIRGGITSGVSFTRGKVEEGLSTVGGGVVSVWNTIASGVGDAASRTGEKVSDATSRITGSGENSLTGAVGTFLEDQKNNIVNRYRDPQTGQTKVELVGGKVVDGVSRVFTEGIEKGAYQLGSLTRGVKTAIFDKIGGLLRGIVGSKDEEQQIETSYQYIQHPYVTINQLYEKNIALLPPGSSERIDLTQKMENMQRARFEYEKEVAGDFANYIKQGKSAEDIIKSCLGYIHHEPGEESSRGYSTRVREIKYIENMLNGRPGLPPIEKVFGVGSAKVSMACFMIVNSTLFDKNANDIVIKRVDKVYNKSVEKQNLSDLIPCQYDMIREEVSDDKSAIIEASKAVATQMGIDPSDSIKLQALQLMISSAIDQRKVDLSV